MVDVHCHLNFYVYEDNYDDMIKSAKKKGVTKIINTGTSIESSTKAVEMAHKYGDLFAIVGIHPHHADKLENRLPFPETRERLGEGSGEWIIELEQLAKRSKVLAIGEIGMDYYSYKSNGIVDPKLQEEVFRKQIELSIKLKLPLQIHNRHAGEDVIRILQEYKSELQNPPGMFHCFAGTLEVLKDALDMGFYIGFDGNITYKGTPPGETVELKDLARLTPLDRMLSETDSPFLTPVPHRGEQNKPEYVEYVVRCLADIKGVSFGEMDRHTTKNASTLFPSLMVQ